MKSLLCSIFLLSIATPAMVAADDAPALIIPPDSGLTLSKSHNEPFEKDFEGQIWVIGTLHVQWLVAQGKPLDSSATLVASIELDKSEMDRLPHFGNDIAPEVWVSNPKEAIEASFDKDVTARLLTQKLQMGQLHGRFLLTKLSVGECGSPWAQATVTKASDQGKARFDHHWGFGDC